MADDRIQPILPFWYAAAARRSARMPPVGQRDPNAITSGTPATRPKTHRSERVWGLCSLKRWLFEGCWLHCAMMGCVASRHGWH